MYLKKTKLVVVTGMSFVWIIFFGGGGMNESDVEKFKRQGF
jgi:hypothetical protein